MARKRRRKLIDLDLENIKERGELNFLYLDLFMVFVVVLNLLLIVFDWHWQFGFFRNFFEEYLNGFYQFYNYKIHPDFLLYDIFFVIIFVVELIVRWIIAIRRETYHQWFFYPFVHWYDVLGCIPLGSFRFLRLFRVFSILMRLQKLHLIDMRKTWVAVQLKKYYDILVEEVTDRVVINILENWQEGIKGGGQLTDKIVQEVIQPKKEPLVEWASHRLQMVAENNYVKKRDEIREDLSGFVGNALHGSDEIKRIKRIPFVGDNIVEQIHESISEAIYKVVDGTMMSMASDGNKAVISKAADALFDSMTMKEKDEKLDKIVKDIAHQSLELWKQDVAVQKWKIKEEEEKEKRRRLKALKKAQKKAKEAEAEINQDGSKSSSGGNESEDSQSKQSNEQNSEGEKKS